jgi:hypothetical protein
MIDPKAKPLYNIPPYKRVDLSQRRKRKSVITAEDIQSGEPEPDPVLYGQNVFTGTWHLKEGK